MAKPAIDGMKTLLAAAAITLAGLAGAWGGGPVDMGQLDLKTAAERKGVPAARVKFGVEQSMALPLESFQIQAGLIRGGSPRAIMYALMEASESVARRGSVGTAKGAAAVPIRGVRRTLGEEDWKLPRETWRAWFHALAKAKFNRARLIWEAEPGLMEQEQFMEMVAGLADEFGVDLAIEPSRSARANLLELLRLSPSIRAVGALRSEPGATAGALRAAGRYVVLEVPPGVSVKEEIPLRILAPWKDGAVRPCSGRCDFIWLVDAPEPSIAKEVLSGPASGFEVESEHLAAWAGAGYEVSASAAAAKRTVKRKTSRSKTSKTKSTAKKRKR